MTEEVKLICPHCDGLHVIKDGFKVTRIDGRKQRLKCQSCGRTFYPVKLDEVAGRRIGRG